MRPKGKLAAFSSGICKVWRSRDLSAAKTPGTCAANKVQRRVRRVSLIHTTLIRASWPSELFDAFACAFEKEEHLELFVVFVVLVLVLAVMTLLPGVLRCCTACTSACSLATSSSLAVSNNERPNNTVSSFPISYIQVNGSTFLQTSSIHHSLPTLHLLTCIHVRCNTKLV